MQYNKLRHVDRPVSALGMGSYETLCYLEYRDIVSLVENAIEMGINLFDVAHYPRAPHTEIILMRALADAGLSRDDYVLVTKVWGRDDRSMSEQLDESLFRLGTDHVDGVLCYGPRWDIGDPTVQATEASNLVANGKASWWGGLNWSASDISTGVAALTEKEQPEPVMMQMKYNFARRNVVESPEYLKVWQELGLVLQASDSLEGGILAAKGSTSRVLGRDPGGIRQRIHDLVPELQDIATEFDVSPAQLALIYAASFEYTGNVLVGASTPKQLRQNAEAIDLVQKIGMNVRDRLNQIQVEGHRLDLPPGTVVAEEDSPYATEVKKSA